MSMNAETNMNQSYGKVAAPRVIEIQRLLPGPIERVWDYLTDSDMRRQWLASGDMKGEAGSSFTLTWRNDELATTSAGTRPEGMPAENSQACIIEEWDPPHKLAYSWGENGLVSFELKPAGNRVLMTLVHSKLPRRGTMVGVSAGWHAHLDVLIGVMEGQKFGPFWDHWSELRKVYDQAIPADA